MARRTPGRVVALEGPSAAGKTTLGRRLATRQRWVFLPEAFDALRPRPSLEVVTPSDLARIEEALLAEERRRSEAALALRDAGSTVLLDTAPFGPATYSAGLACWMPEFGEVAWQIVRRVAEEVRTGRLIVPDRVLYLDVPAATLRRRAGIASRLHPAELRERHTRVGSIERAFWERLAERLPTSVKWVPAEGSATRTGKLLSVQAIERGARLRPASVVAALRRLPRRPIPARIRSGRRPRVTKRSLS